MKKIKFLAIVTILAISTSVSAQFTNSKSSTLSSANDMRLNSIYVQWNPTKYEKQSINAFSLGYNRAISVSPSIPLFVETGIALQYSFKSYSNFYGDWYDDWDDDWDDYWSYSPGFAKANDYGDDDKLKFNMISVKVPVSLTYNWQVADAVAIAPFAGITLRGNIYGRYKEGGDSFNVFNKDEAEYLALKRFQIGWHAGVNFKFNDRFFIGGSYGTDFNEIAKKVKAKTGSITAGFIF